ncbi:MAG: hypothetical protein ACP5E4_03770, partial [Candidatus Aenigmatarchaeota archaeon]
CQSVFGAVYAWTNRDYYYPGQHAIMFVYADTHSKVDAKGLSIAVYRDGNLFGEFEPVACAPKSHIYFSKGFFCLYRFGVGDLGEYSADALFEGMVVEQGIAKFSVIKKPFWKWFW